jgi:putative effector of murein hydrolase
MKKVLFMFKEGYFLVKKHKFYFLAPLLIAVVLLTFLVIEIGPAAIVSFIYAGL